MQAQSQKTVILHGFSQEEALAVMRLVKSAASDPAGLIFAMTTEQSLERPLKQTLADLAEEHGRLKRPKT